jgi:hypothetical protein
MLGGESRRPWSFLCFISRLSFGDAQNKCLSIPSTSCRSYEKAIILTPVDTLIWIQEVPQPTTRKQKKKPKLIHACLWYGEFSMFSVRSISGKHVEVVQIIFYVKRILRTID